MSKEITNTITLRKLSRKSIIDFGKCRGHSIQQILDLKHTRYIRWIYYNIEGLSFLDDILEEVHITERNKIEKPGINPKLGKEVDAFLFAHRCNTKGDTVKMAAHVKKENRLHNYRMRKCNSYKEKKSVLQAHNHGKF